MAIPISTVSRNHAALKAGPQGYTINDLGGAMRGDWPGLGQLEDNRDLRVATDSRAVIKGVLRDHLGIGRAALDQRVFPDAAALKPMDGLVRT